MTQVIVPFLIGLTFGLLIKARIALNVENVYITDEKDKNKFIKGLKDGYVEE